MFIAFQKLFYPYLCFLETREQQFTEQSFAKIVDYFHFENGKEILDW